VLLEGLGSTQLPSATDTQQVGIHATSGDEKKLYWDKFSDLSVLGKNSGERVVQRSCV